MYRVNYLNIGIALLIGIFIGWLLFHSTTPQKFIGLSPLIDEISTHTSIFLENNKLKEKKEEEEEEEEEEEFIFEKYIKEEKKYNKPFESKGEAETKRSAEEIFKCKFRKIRPKWLTNPETNRRMEIDAYNDELKIGLEYNGRQHYVFPNGFHKTIEEYEKQKERDRLKLDLCDKNGVYLITIPYTIKICDIKNFIDYYQPKNREHRLKNGLTGSNI